MVQEIERKFLVRCSLSDILQHYENVSVTHIEQRYLSDSGKWTLRVRQTTQGIVTQHWLTLKRRQTNVSCTELESPISADFHNNLLTQTGPVLSKTRYTVKHQDHVWEIDQFHHPVFNGLVVAEIELSHENEEFHKPDWLGLEVTEDKQFKNAKMAKLLEVE